MPAVFVISSPPPSFAPDFAVNGKHWAATNPTLTNNTEDHSTTGGLFCLDSYICNLAEESDEPDTHGRAATTSALRSVHKFARGTIYSHRDASVIHFPSSSTSHPERYRRHVLPSSYALAIRSWLDVGQRFSSECVNIRKEYLSFEGAQINVKEATPAFGRWRRPILEQRKSSVMVPSQYRAYSPLPSPVVASSMQCRAKPRHIRRADFSHQDAFTMMTRLHELSKDKHLKHLNRLEGRSVEVVAAYQSIRARTAP
ncbi:hypothetical protein EV421DRAFT_1905949 [Armillaria borealis]|uniref:Uncharacterized protein n=1 Tax=Armillaria borealis TaxID=47425 RepID=A0AA39JBE2_9AGAR|nr:hypothetical protein EV421DRAFT_1905949 [Armillaria borealis]